MTQKREDILLTAILQVKGDVGELRGEVQQIILLETRVRALEQEGSRRRGAGHARKTIWSHCWEIGKLAASALAGGFAAHRIFK